MAGACGAFFASGTEQKDEGTIDLMVNGALYFLRAATAAGEEPPLLVLSWLFITRSGGGARLFTTLSSHSALCW